MFDCSNPAGTHHHSRGDGGSRFGVGTRESSLDHRPIGGRFWNGIDSVLVRRLQLGDADGDMRRALASSPILKWPNASSIATSLRTACRTKHRLLAP